jgi:hypothetical protein
VRAMIGGSVARCWVKRSFKPISITIRPPQHPPDHKSNTGHTLELGVRPREVCESVLPAATVSSCEVSCSSPTQAHKQKCSRHRTTAADDDAASAGAANDRAVSFQRGSGASDDVLWQSGTCIYLLTVSAMP